MKTIIKLIIKVLQKISKYTLTSIFTQIFNILKGKSVIRSFLMLFRWLSLLFTVLFLINDSLALNFVDSFKDFISHPSLILDRFKNLWNKIVDFILNILGKTKLENSDDIIPEPKMFLDKNEDKLLLMDINKDKIQFMDKNSLQDYINQHNKTGKDVRIIIEDAAGNKFNDNWSWYWKLGFILGLFLAGGFIITIIPDGIKEMIYIPFIWAYDNVLHPLYVFFGVIFYFIRYFLGGGGDPGDFANSIRDQFGVEIFHFGGDNNLPDNAHPAPTDNPDVQEIRINDERTSSNKGKGKFKSYYEEPLFGKNQPDDSRLPEWSNKKFNNSTMTIENENSPILSQINTSEAFTPSNIITSDASSSNISTPKPAGCATSTNLDDATSSGINTTTLASTSSGVDTAENSYQKYAQEQEITRKKSSFLDAITKPKALKQVATVEEVEDMMNSRQGKIGRIFVKDPIVQAAENSPMLQRALDEKQEAEESFSDEENDGNRIKKMKKNMGEQFDRQHLPSKPSTPEISEEEHLHNLDHLGRQGAKRTPFAPSLPHQPLTPAGSAAIQRVAKSAARKFITENNPFSDIWND
jgi:hypothetical protein